VNQIGIYYPEPEWFRARIGLLTSSKIHDAITKRQKGGTHDLAARRKLKFQMLAEMSTKMTTEHYVSMAMDWGVENEPRARAEYEYRTGLSVEPLGLVLHPDNPRAGATADGWIKEEGGILEIKCPETDTHWEYLASGEIPTEYLDQIDWQMACCGPEIEWCDFVSYDPRIEDQDLQLLTVRRERNSKRIAEMEDLASEFLIELIQLFEQVKRKPRNITLEDKLRASIRQATGHFPDPEIDNLAITEEDIRA
jgi:putative phage-type endonuclease